MIRVLKKDNKWGPPISFKPINESFSPCNFHLKYKIHQLTTSNNHVIKIHKMKGPLSLHVEIIKFTKI
jgi:hypothetical protein